MNIRTLFEDELQRRGLAFDIDEESGRHAVEVGGGRMLVSLENLDRDVARDGDTGRIARFVDAIVASSSASESDFSADRLYWCLEPSDHREKADYRVALSDRVDRVLVHISSDNRLVTWVTPDHLQSLGISESDAGTTAFANLARALSEATIESEDIEGVQLGFTGTSLPFKASLILAPNLRQIVGVALGWPLMAVVPDRDFLYLWAARHSDFVQRLGGVVVREYSQASYPISTEVYEITDETIRAIGEFPMPGLKTICYRGGIVRFDIPRSWKEEYEPSGGATFYEDRPDSGTLRLNVLSLSSNGKETGSEMISSLVADSGFEPLHDGLAIKQYVKSAEQEGQQLQIHYWEIAVPVEGCSTRLAIFSFTILASQASDQKVLNDIELLQDCIRAATFSREQGVSGDCPEG
jgi:hypothetical protein